MFDHLVTDFPEGDIGGRVIEVGGLRIAGLGGVFKPRIWYPRADEPGGRIEPPSFNTRREFLDSLPLREHWRGGLPLWHRDSIFPEDFAQLAQHRFDVLVTHEAPSCHRHGFAAIDRLAEVAAARLIVHGHHHESVCGEAGQRHRRARPRHRGAVGAGDGVKQGWPPIPHHQFRLRRSGDLPGCMATTSIAAVRRRLPGRQSVA